MAGVVPKRLDPLRVGSFPCGAGLGAQRPANHVGLPIQLGRLGIRQDPGVTRGQLDAVMILAEGKPFDVRMGAQHGMGIKRDETHLADLGHFELTEDLPRQVLIEKSLVAETDGLAGDLPLAITLEIEIDWPNDGKRDPPDHTAGLAVVQKSFLDPMRVGELLGHPNYRDP